MFFLKTLLNFKSIHLAEYLWNLKKSKSKISEIIFCHTYHKNLIIKSKCQWTCSGNITVYSEMPLRKKLDVTETSQMIWNADQFRCRWFLNDAIFYGKLFSNRLQFWLNPKILHILQTKESYFIKWNHWEF